jgi:HopA1 effector protein family
METDLRLACAEIFRALAIVRPDSLRLHDQHYRCDPDRLVTALMTAVYTEFYCKLTIAVPNVTLPELLTALSAANQGGPSRRNATMEQSGTYVALGQTHPPGTRWLRFYWNVDHRGAIELMASATATLNRQQVPFRLKVLLDVSVRRRDAVVLYVPLELWSAGGMVIANAYDALVQAGTLWPETPLFTKALRPGVGLAEDPATGASFGMHRAGLVARAMAKSYLRGRCEDHEQWEELRNEFALEGLSLAQPYLNAGSCDVYAL